EARDEPLRVDHDIVVMLGDWLYRSPYAALAALKKGPAKRMAVGAKMAGMKPDLADIEYDVFLLNGRGTRDPWTYQARPGERIRLRIINAAASTYFRLRLDGHPLAITHADGLAVKPVTVDYLQMGMAETYDAVVTLSGSGSYTLHAVAVDGSGQAIGVLHTPDAAAKPNHRDADVRGPRAFLRRLTRHGADSASSGSGAPVQTRAARQHDQVRLDDQRTGLSEGRPAPDPSGRSRGDRIAQRDLDVAPNAPARSLFPRPARCGGTRATQAHCQRRAPRDRAHRVRCRQSGAVVLPLPQPLSPRSRHGASLRIRSVRSHVRPFQ